MLISATIAKHTCTFFIMMMMIVLRCRFLLPLELVLMMLMG